MADPLGLIGGGAGGAGAGPEGLRGLRGLRGLHGGVGNVSGAFADTGQGAAADIGAEPGQMPSFAKSLLNQIDEVNKLQAEAGQAVEDAMTGKRDDIENVMAGAQKADTAFRMLLSLRNKVQTAYEEIKQVRI